MRDKYLFVSRHDFNLSNFEQVRNRNSRPYGGLWTSTFNRETGSEWLQSKLCYLTEDAKGYVLECEPSSNILSINTVSEALAALDKYCIEQTIFARRDGEEYALGLYVIDFELISKHFDAIHVTGEAVQIYKKHKGRFSPFADWLVDSTVWFNANRIKLIETLDNHTLLELKRE